MQKIISIPAAILLLASSGVVGQSEFHGRTLWLGLGSTTLLCLLVATCLVSIQNLDSNFIFSHYCCASISLTDARPVNDRCVDSVTLTMGEKVLGDNTYANFDYNNQGVCGSRSDRRAVWYEINGVGKEVTVNVCTNNDQITDFGVFRACNTQNCLGAPPQQRISTSCENDESNEYKFFGNEGESYYIHVRSDVVFEGVGSNVSFD